MAHVSPVRITTSRLIKERVKNKPIVILDKLSNLMVNVYFVPLCINQIRESGPAYRNKLIAHSIPDCRPTGDVNRITAHKIIRY